MSMNVEFVSNRQRQQPLPHNEVLNRVLGPIHSINRQWYSEGSLLHRRAPTSGVSCRRILLPLIGSFNGKLLAAFRRPMRAPSFHTHTHTHTRYSTLWKPIMYRDGRNCRYHMHRFLTRHGPVCSRQLNNENNLEFTVLCHVAVLSNHYRFEITLCCGEMSVCSFFSSKSTRMMYCHPITFDRCGSWGMRKKRERESGASGLLSKMSLWDEACLL